MIERLYEIQQERLIDADITDEQYKKKSKEWFLQPLLTLEGPASVFLYALIPLLCDYHNIFYLIFWSVPYNQDFIYLLIVSFLCFLLRLCFRLFNLFNNFSIIIIIFHYTIYKKLFF